MWLEETRKSRNIPWLRRGMRVYCSHGRWGRVSGGNSHANLQITLDGQSHSRNFHPQWELVYFDKNGNIIKDYRVNQDTEVQYQERKSGT